MSTRSDHGVIWCQRPYLNTGFGAVAQCSQYTSTSAPARFGLFSPLTGKFEPSIGWLDVTQGGNVSAFRCHGTDGHNGTCVGIPIENTPYGGAAKVTQYQATRGRWGWWNVIIEDFNPEGGWFPRGND